MKMYLEAPSIYTTNYWAANGYNYLDSKPQTSSKAHRPSYGTDGDYFSKPSAEDILKKVYAMMNEVDPSKFPNLY
jgi:hypothetical protein